MRITRGLVVLMAVAACGGGTPKAEDADAASQEDVALPTGPDPCALVSQVEMEALIGPLAEPPYRVDSNREPKVDGEGCFYRARDRRNVTLMVDWEGGEMSFRMLAGTGQAVTDILVGYDPATDTLEGTWDKVGAAFGQFIALKGPTSVQVDPVGSRMGLDGAARLASLALGRVASPLDYSGAKATMARTETSVTARNPCDLLTRAEVEAAMGPLKEAPRPTADRSECEFVTTQEFFGEPVTRALKVTWTDGFYAFGQQRLGVAGAKKIMEAQIDADLPTLSESAGGKGEPWDERITLIGGEVTVVKADVMLQLVGDGIGGFDEAKALSLLRIAAGRL